MLRTFFGLFALILLSYSSAAQSPQPLTGRALDNGVAFTRLVGYVRYFYPGDEAASINWDDFTIQHIESVETAADAAQLTEQLNVLFAPYAPLLRIYPTGATTAIPAELQSPPESATYITMWLHIPLRTSTSPVGLQVWPGKRLQAALDVKTIEFTDNPWLEGLNPPLTVDVHDPSQPYIADLGAGVSALIPLAVYGDSTGTLPHTSNLPAIDASAGTSQAVYLAAVAKAWNALQHFFTYWDVNKSDWDSVLRMALSEASLAADNASALVALRRMMAQLHDGHSFTTDTTSQGASPAVLPFTWDIVENQLMVTTILTDESPLKPGDIITAINGEPAMQVIQQHLDLISPIGGYGLFNALNELSRRVDAQTLNLEVKPASGGETFIINVNYVIHKSGWIRENRPPTIADLGEGVLYLDLTRATMADIQNAMSRLVNAKGIVFDMRGYPTDAGPIELLGHLTDEPLSTAPFWMPIVTRPDHQNIRYLDVQSVWSQPTAPRLTDNIAWLINGNNTVSYAESIMGIVEGYHLGQIVGAPSAGTNGDITYIPLPGGFRTQWTGLRVTKFDGSPLMNVGVLPTIPVERTLAGVAAGRDELLDRAFEVVSGKSASTMTISSQ